MSQAETWTVKRLLEWTTEFFKKKGIDTPRLEAEILLAAAMKLRRIELYTHFETEPAESQRTLFREFVKRRGIGEPVAYLVGFKEFFSIPFKVNRTVLIPRPETEQLVLETLDILKTFSDTFSSFASSISTTSSTSSLSSSSQTSLVVCDVGTGSGAIAIALAKNLPPSLKSTTIIAVDLCPEALSVAESNAVANGVADRIEFRCSDLLTEVAGQFDVIVGNLPYISRSEYDVLPDDVRKFEPQQALLAGLKGTEVIERLAVQAAEKLKPGGFLLLECSPMIAESVVALFADWKETRILKDNTGRQRFVISCL
ncbi:MAG: peptide chain release factor N(5)-glutamine methyltransferase [Planctomycetaceae bacterium]|jgi:release factor glutamine methyltransferase|nr:peptide chain release factor N(5)-glutamine methyltransferase [Planctomycetaceae bacterium]